MSVLTVEKTDLVTHPLNAEDSFDTFYYTYVVISFHPSVFKKFLQNFDITTVICDYGNQYDINMNSVITNKISFMLFQEFENIISETIKIIPKLTKEHKNCKTVVFRVKITNDGEQVFNLYNCSWNCKKLFDDMYWQDLMTCINETLPLEILYKFQFILTIISPASLTNIPKRFNLINYKPHKPNIDAIIFALIEGKLKNEGSRLTKNQLTQMVNDLKSNCKNIYEIINRINESKYYR
ncbi:hypothetical protein HANVADRAFT_1412 [Hanseniaspora valbyensis NRRL Y-1626]|uniref:Uncharacterized protein n=1 Tax=Hanseniaspora valbyensis NRRL Y-1626 TaxID=766949 RepID=A0A1B7TGQ9_9ASCO|nr:hypothetical protein HANVADRAFT_1412 [Hanseniaspora valbyensis NRRL Y-1626]